MRRGLAVVLLLACGSVTRVDGYTKTYALAEFHPENASWTNSSIAGFIDRALNDFQCDGGRPFVLSLDGVSDGTRAWGRSGLYLTHAANPPASCAPGAEFTPVAGAVVRSGRFAAETDIEGFVEGPSLLTNVPIAGGDLDRESTTFRCKADSNGTVCTVGLRLPIANLPELAAREILQGDVRLELDADGDGLEQATVTGTGLMKTVHCFEADGGGDGGCTSPGINDAFVYDVDARMLPAVRTGE